MSREAQEKLKTIEHYSYYLSDNIGKGFSSIVYKGKNKQNGLPVAIKVIDLRKLSESTMRQLLQSQIGIIKSLSHSNILKCENVYITVNNCYIITELCQGGDLASEIKKKGRLRGVQALKTMLQITKAIHHIAKLNIIHRDIKPANILLHEGCVKLADFGFARYEQQGKKQKYNVGSPLYMSPQALFSNFYSKQNDIWSLGVVFYEILQGRPPWDPKNEKQLKDILKEKKQVFFRIAVRDELETIIRGCLKHERSQRMSLQSILEALQSMMKQMQTQNNSAYRETLTKRNLNTLSCKDLNTTTSSIPTVIATPRLLMPKIPKPPQAQTPLLLHKQNSKKQQKQPQSQPSILRNRSAIQLKQKPGQPQPPNVPLEEASRHNHWILKSTINYSRLIYKTFARLDKLQIRQPLRLEIQSTIVDLLQHSINWLKDAITNAKQAEKFGIVNFEKFRETRCYSKTILVINQYYQRYTKFVTKTRRFLDSKKTQTQLSFSGCLSKLKKSIKDLYVHSCKKDHNIGLDFLLSIIILTQMIQTGPISSFAQQSHIEQIVETEPLTIEDEETLKQLANKLQNVIAY